MAVLGLDFGDKTIGVAISDGLGLTAQGLTVLRRERPEAYKQNLRELAQIVEERQVTKIVLGLPKNLDNSEGDRCEKTRAFGLRLEKRFPQIPVVLWDERFSTVAVNAAMRAGGLSAEKRKQTVDMLAAVYILQGYLDNKGV